MDRDQGQPEDQDATGDTSDEAAAAGSTGSDAGNRDESMPTEALPAEAEQAPEPESSRAQGSGFAVPSGFDGGPSLPYGTGQMPPVPPHNPYASVPGAPSGAAGGQYPGQPGQAPFSNPGYQGQGYQGQPGQPGYPSYQPGYPGQPGPYGNQGMNPGQPGYGSYMPPPSTPGKALAIAALVLGILALLVCWIPFVNVITFPLAIVGVGLGIPALIKGIKAKSIAKPLSIAALSVAVVTIVAAIVVNSLFVDSLRDSGLWESETEAGTESYTEPEDYSEELLEAEQEDYSYEYSDTYISGLVSEPANSAGEEVTVGDYTVTLTELDRDAAAEVQERDPNAGAPDHNYVIARFSAVYNGSSDGRPWLDLPAELIGTDNRIYSVLGCSSSLGQRSVDQELLSTGDSVTVERCFDVPDGALGEDSRLAMRMILAEENNNEVHWRLP